MPVLSCGGMRYQYKWQDQPLSAIPEDSQRNLEATVRRAFELGIVHIETARGYGSSERQLGLVLPTLPRSELIVQTKIAPHEDPRVFEQHFAESLERLQLDSVELLSLHGVNDRTTLEWSIRRGGCFEAAQRLRDRGKVRFIGFSSHAPLDVLLAGIRHGGPRLGEGFDYVNLHFYFILQRNRAAILAAAERDMGVFIISPSDKGGKLYAPPTKLRQLCEPLSPMVFNDLFCLSEPHVHTISIGAARPSDFDEHLRAVELLPRAGELLPPIVDRLGQAMQAAVGVRDPELVTQGLPEVHDAPSGLNLRVMLWLRNLALGWDLMDYGKMRFNMLGGADHWFPGADPHLITKADPESLKRALADSPYAEQIPGWLRESVALLAAAPVKRLSQQSEA